MSNHKEELINNLTTLDLLHDALYFMDSEDFEDQQYDICNQLQDVIDNLRALKDGGT